MTDEEFFDPTRLAEAIEVAYLYETSTSDVAFRLVDEYIEQCMGGTSDSRRKHYEAVYRIYRTLNPEWL